MDDIFAQMLLEAEKPLEEPLPKQENNIVESKNNAFERMIAVSSPKPAKTAESDDVPKRKRIPRKEGLESVIDELKNVKKTRAAAKKKDNMIEVNDFDQTMNILDIENRAQFVAENVANETKQLSAPQLTTVTVVGAYANIKMMEEDWIKYMSTNRHILVCSCNFGRIVYDKYTPPPRKEKAKKKKSDRKVQGNGSEFNSQITLFANAEPHLFTDDDIIPTNTPVFKFKLFRNGKIQLPGGRKEVIDNIVDATRYIEAYCNRIFNPSVVDLLKLIKVINVNISMKNYKFIIKLGENQIVNLERLKELFTSYKIRGETSIGVFDIIPNGSLTNLSIEFNTPVYGNDDKHMRMTIEKSGKVNIKGALYIDYTTQAFDLLDKFLKNDKTALINKYRPTLDEYNVPMSMSNAELIARLMMAI